RDNTRQGNEATGIARPALQDGEIQKRKTVFLNNFLARSAGNIARKEIAHVRQHGKHLDFVEQPLRALHIQKEAQALGDVVEGVHTKRQVHATRGAELVDQDL